MQAHKGFGTFIGIRFQEKGINSRFRHAQKPLPFPAKRLSGNAVRDKTTGSLRHRKVFIPPGRLRLGHPGTRLGGKKPERQFSAYFPALLQRRHGDGIIRPASQTAADGIVIVINPPDLQYPVPEIVPVFPALRRFRQIAGFPGVFFNIINLEGILVGTDILPDSLVPACINNLLLEPGNVPVLRKEVFIIGRFALHVIFHIKYARLLLSFPRKGRQDGNSIRFCRNRHPSGLCKRGHPVMELAGSMANAA